MKTQKKDEIDVQIIVTNTENTVTAKVPRNQLTANLANTVSFQVSDLETADATISVLKAFDAVDALKNITDCNRKLEVISILYDLEVELPYSYLLTSTAPQPQCASRYILLLEKLGELNLRLSSIPNSILSFVDLTILNESSRILVADRLPKFIVGSDILLMYTATGSIVYGSATNERVIAGTLFKGVIVTSSWTRALRYWQQIDGKYIRTLSLDTSNAISMSSSYDEIICGCDDGQVKTIDEDNIINSVKAHTGTVSSVAYTRTSIISCGVDSYLRIWTKDLLPLRTINFGDMPLYSVVTFETKVAVASSNGYIYIIDPSKDDKPSIIVPESSPVCLAASDNFLAIGSLDGVQIVDLQNRDTGYILPITDGSIASIAFLTQNQVVFSNTDGDIMTWDFINDKTGRIASINPGKSFVLRASV